MAFRKTMIIVGAVAALGCQLGFTKAGVAADVAGPGSEPYVGYLPIGLFRTLEEAEDPNYSPLDETPWTIGLSFATDTFSHPADMKGNPARVALAVAALDALAGQISVADVPLGVNPMSDMLMRQARKRLRSILGIADAAPSQSVINHLVLASQALATGDQALALQQLCAPDFTKPSAQTFAILSDFPFVPLADDATSDLSAAVDKDLH